MTHSKKREIIFVSLYCFTLVAVIGSLTLSFNSYVDKVAFGITAAYALFYFIYEYKKHKASCAEQIKNLMQSCKWILSAIVAYMVWDFITLFYAPDYSIVIEKYPFRLEYFLILVMGLAFCLKKERLILLIKTISCIGIVVALYSYLAYWLSTRPIYFQRLSTARDYNVFSTVMLFSMIFAIVYLLAYSKLPFIKRILILSGYLIFTMPAYYLSGSRRHIIMAPIFFAFAVIYEFFRNFPKTAQKKKMLLQSFAVLALCAVVYAGGMAISEPFSTYGDYRAQKYLSWISQATPEDGNATIDKEVTISDAIGTISNATMTNKRMLIYSVAFNELKESSPAKLIFGGGSAYDIHMYDNTHDTALLEAYKYNTTDKRPYHGWMYSHNFMLSDILCGGIIQLLLGLNIVVALIYSAVKAICLDHKCGVIVAVLSALVITNNFISYPYGLLNDVLFYVIVLTICGIIYHNKNSGKAKCNE